MTGKLLILGNFNLHHSICTTLFYENPFTDFDSSLKITKPFYAFHPSNMYHADFRLNSLIINTYTTSFGHKSYDCLAKNVYISYMLGLILELSLYR